MLLLFVSFLLLVVFCFMRANLMALPLTLLLEKMAWLWQGDFDANGAGDAWPDVMRQNHIQSPVASCKWWSTNLAVYHSLSMRSHSDDPGI